MKFKMLQQRKSKETLSAQIAAYPQSPGVYLMKDRHSQIIYVGKAKNLRARVRQYFTGKDERFQIQFLMARLAEMDFIQTTTEREALLLENSLIKKHKPRYNIFLKDDKSYLGLKLTIKDSFPRVLTTRRVKKDGSLYYGPFMSADALYEVKEFIDRYFQLRTCSDHEFAARTRPCLEHQMGRCSAPCVGLVDPGTYALQIQSIRHFLEGKNRLLQRSIEKRRKAAAAQESFEEAAHYRDLLKGMEALLERQKVTALSFEFLDVLALCREGERVGVAVLMVREAKLIDSKYFTFRSLENDEDLLINFLSQYYTENSFIPREILVPIVLATDVIGPILQERAGTKVTLSKPQKGERADLLHMAAQNLASHFVQNKKAEGDRQKTLETLQEKLGLLRLPKNMECYDISNISGTYAVGSLVTFQEGEPFKAGYRRFKIHGIEGPDDYAMMQQVLERRFKRTDWPHPDLVIVDGGKGQLGKALLVMDELGIKDIDVIGVAKGHGQGARSKGLWEGKKEEEIYLPGRKNPVILSRGSPEILLLQRIRDEAHRFAISYHRQLREKAGKTSWLESVAGIGPAKRKALLKHFGSAAGVAAASLGDLAEAGLSQPVAEAIKKVGKKA